MIQTHSFHIPVMGIGFTIDTPLRVSQYGINSVISLVDDILLEKLRKMYCSKNDIPYEEISNKEEDFRARRITSYLNLIKKLAVNQFNELMDEDKVTGNHSNDYFERLPDSSVKKQEYQNLKANNASKSEIDNWVNKNLSMGSIEVNIMTKLDKVNYKNGEKLPQEFNDGHSAVRGYAKSELESSIILSAGMNPGLYGYLAQFDDFFPDKNGFIKKKIALKVSDYRSASIQGKFLAKKGLWVSEYRIESGLNCGGHAFATDGYLMGPILEEFKERRQELHQSIYEVLVKSLSDKNKDVPEAELPLRISAQGGVGTSEEHKFLLDHYQIDSVGWGTPFLLVPEVTNVDEETLTKLIDAKEEDLYLSKISPLGVPFNSLRGNSKDIQKMELINKGRPGSNCPKKFLVSNIEYTDAPICTASRHYQHLKIKEAGENGVSPDEYVEKFDKIVEKACICVGLGTAALLKNNLETKVEGSGVSICPGPNMAYFNKIKSLSEMMDHIYGKVNIIERSDRPNMFVKELNIYINFLKEKMAEMSESVTNKQKNYLLAFVNNLDEGIIYYQNLFSELKYSFEETKSRILADLEDSKEKVNSMISEIEEMVASMAVAH